MKKCFVLLFLVLVCMTGALAVDEPTIGGTFGVDGSGENDAEKLQGTIDDYVPIDESGEIDYGKYDPFVTKAELRIAAINLWLDENAGWMRYIFHMKPEVSWLFIINVYVLLWFFVVLFLNAEGLWFFIEKKGGAKIFGFGLFFILLVARLYYGIAILIHNWLVYLIDVVLPTGIVSILLFGVLVIVLGWLGFPLAGAILAWWTRYRKTREEIKRVAEMEASTEAMDALINQVRPGSKD